MCSTVPKGEAQGHIKLKLNEWDEWHKQQEALSRTITKLFTLWDIWDNWKISVDLVFLDLIINKCPGGRAAYLPAAEQKAQGTLRGQEVSACSWRHRKLPPERLSPGREPRRSAAPTVRRRNCDQRAEQREDTRNNNWSIFMTTEQTLPTDEGHKLLLKAPEVSSNWPLYWEFFVKHKMSWNQGRFSGSKVKKMRSTNVWYF